MRYQPSVIRDAAGVPRVQKAHAYVTQGGRLLVFEHRDEPESGVQIPAGTVRMGEIPEAAVRREVAEETGLADLDLVQPLGWYDWQVDPGMVPKGHDRQRRHAFHLEARGDVEESWVHWERGDDDAPRFAFVFRWLPLWEAGGVLAPFLGRPGTRMLAGLPGERPLHPPERQPDDEDRVQHVEA